MTEAADIQAPPILVGHRCVPADLRLPKRSDGMVELTPFIGRAVPLTPKGLRALLGCDLPVIHALVDAGVLLEDVARAGLRKRYLLVDPSISFPSIYAGWLAAFPPPRDYAAFQIYKDVRSKCRIAASEPHPEFILEAALEFLIEMNAINRHELRGVLPCTKESEEEIVHWMKARLGRSRQTRFADGMPPPSLETFRLMLPDEIANAPQTCFDPTFQGAFTPPEPAVLARLARLGPMFEAGSLHILRRAALVRGQGVLSGRTRAVELLDKAFRAAGHETLPTDLKAIGDVLTAFAIDGTLVRETGDFPRTLAGYAWETIRRDVEAVAEAAAAEVRPRLLRWVPPPHPANLSYHGALAEAEGLSRKAGRRKRKRASDPVADMLPVLHEQLAKRAEQSAGLADEGHKAALALAANPGLAFKDFEFTSPVLLMDGTILDTLQTVMMRCWRRPALLRLLVLDGEGNAMQRRKPGAPRAGERREGPSIRDVKESVRTRLAALEEHGDDGGDDDDEFYFEYVGTMAADPDTSLQTCEPWFITLLRDGAIVRPAMLPVAMRERRRDLIIQHGLPGYVGSTAGLLGFGRPGSLVFRASAEHAVPRVIVPLAQFDHAMRIAHLVFCAQAESSCRVGEALQMRPIAGDGWEPMPGTGESIWQFLAVPKQWGDSHDPLQVKDPYRRYPVDDDTITRAEELEQVLIRRCHPGGEVPPVRPSASAAWKLADAPYIVSFGEQAIGADMVNLFYRYLTAGIAAFTSHHVRHASARARRKSKATIGQVALALGNSRKLAGWYSRITEAEAANAYARNDADGRARERGSATKKAKG